MLESIKENLNSWNRTENERDKLQHLYMAVAILLLIAAGVLGLLNQNLGQQVLAVAIVSAGVFIVNAVSWALLQSFVLNRLDKPARRATTKKK